MASAGDELPRLRQREGAVAGIGDGAIGELDLEEPLALDAEIEWPAGNFDPAPPLNT